MKLSLSPKSLFKSHVSGILPQLILCEISVTAKQFIQQLVNVT